MALVPAILQASYDVLNEENKTFEGYLRSRLHDSAPLAGIESTEVFLPQPAAEKPTVIFVLGGPGAGKGTQCTNIVEEFGYCHISAGDCLRAERESGSAEAELINTFIREGKIVPVEITIRLLLKAMKTSGKNKFLIDGFPRDLDNLAGWNRVVGDTVNVAFVMFFECPEDTMLVRLLKRGETSGRTDDNISSIRKRFLVYHEATMPVVHVFERAGKVRYLKADQPKELVYMNVQRIMRDLEASLVPRTLWIAQYRLAAGAVAEAVAAEHGKFADELSKRMPPGSIKVSTVTLMKAVDPRADPGAGGCVVA